MTKMCAWSLAGMIAVAGASAGAQTVRDSAGIHIIENTKPLWTTGQEWRVSPAPVVDIGGSGGPDYELGRIAGVVRLRNGTIVAADEQSYQLRFYNASGHHLRSVGRKGQGPGEFSGNIGSLTVLAGDTLAVDIMMGTSAFTPEGVFIRSVTLGPFRPGTVQSPVMVLGRFGDGTAIASDFPQGQRRPAGAQRWVDSSSLFLLDRTGAIARPLGTLPTVVFGAVSQRPSPLNFGPEFPHASSGNLFYSALGDRYSINVYSPDWRLQRIIRRSWTPAPITSRDIDTYVDGWATLWIKTTGPAAEKERKDLRDEAYAEVLPALSTILPSRSGELWVRVPSLDGAPGCWCVAGVPTVPSRWSVFDAEGRWLGDVAMPARFTPEEIGADYVLGVARGADDVRHVVMYRLEKPR